jgi:hypothetical protein
MLGGFFLITNQFLQLLGVKNVANQEVNRKIQGLILPYWYKRQNDPHSPAYMAGGPVFRNLIYRNWTVVSPAKFGITVLVDRFGVIYLPDQCISIELWVNSGDRLFTPDNFNNISQQQFQGRGLETLNFFDTGVCSARLIADPNSNNGQITYNISVNSRPEDTLKTNGFYLVIRPYDYNGLSTIHHMEYNENCLQVNHKGLIFFDKEPRHCYFADGVLGDVTKYLYSGEGNTKLTVKNGMGTGMVGFSGLPAELCDINIHIGVPKKSFITKPHFTKYNFQFDVSECLNRIQTATTVDQLLTASLKYLKMFCNLSYSDNIYQILALNRFSDGSQSCYILKDCLRRVGWDGSTRGMGQAELVWGVFDYFKMSGDLQFIERNWPVLKRLGYAIWHQKVKVLLINNSGPINGQDNFFEQYFWLCAALKALEKLAHSLEQTNLAQLYKEQKLALQSKLLWLLTNSLKHSGSRIIPLQFNISDNVAKYGAAIYGAGIVKNLTAAYPLQLWRCGNSFIKDSIKFILEEYSYRGGIFSPLEFQGIDLALSARLGQVLIREGYDYTWVLELMLVAGGGAWSLPDRIHPLTLNGIGDNGHDPEVLYQLLLLIRNIFVLEEDNYLELGPGLFSSIFWEQPKIKISRLNTCFGEISYNCHSIGDQIQIDFWPQFRIRPEKIRIDLHHKYQPVYVDNSIKIHDSILEISPDFHILRLKKQKSTGLS